MVTLSEFKENIKTLLKKYLYTKEETRQNFDNYFNSNLKYDNSNLLFYETIFEDTNPLVYKYTSTNAKAILTYDNTNNYYILSNTSGSDGFGSIILNNITVSDHCILTMDIMIPSQSDMNIQPRLSVFSSKYGVGLNFAKPSTSTSEFSIREKIVKNGERTTTGFVSDTNTINYDEWYTMKLIILGDTFIGELYNSDGTLNRRIFKNIQGVINTVSNSVGIQFTHTNNSKCYFKNLKVLNIPKPSNSIVYRNTDGALNLHNPQGAIITSNNNIITITTDTSGEKKVNSPTCWFNGSENAYMEMTYCGGTTQPIALALNTESNTSLGWLSHNGDNKFTNGLGTSTSSVTGTISVGDVFRLSREKGVSKFYQNGTLLFSTTRTISSTTYFRFGFYTNEGRVQRWKNIKVGYL